MAAAICQCQRTSKLSSAPMGSVSTSGLAARLETIMSTVRKKLAPMRSICEAHIQKIWRYQYLAHRHKSCAHQDRDGVWTNMEISGSNCAWSHSCTPVDVTIYEAALAVSLAL